MVIFFMSVPPIFADTLYLSLPEAECRALINSDELDLAEIGLQLARQQIRAGDRVCFPYLRIKYENGNRVIFDKQDTKTNTLTFEMEQLLFDGGKNAARHELSVIQLDLQRMAFDQKQEELFDAVWDYYNSILVLEEKSRIQEQNCRLAGEQLLIARKQYELGAIRQIDLVETELEITGLRQARLETVMQLEDAWFDFGRLIGFQNDNNIILTDKINKEYGGSVITLSAEAMYRQALRSNIDISNIDAQIFRKEKELSFASRTWIPELTGAISLSFSGDEFPLGSPSLSATINISFPDKLLPLSAALSAATTSSGRSLSGSGSLPLISDITQPLDKKELRTMISSLRLQKDMYKKDLLTEIQRMVRNYENLCEKVFICRESLEFQRSKLMIYETQFELGEITNLELLETRNELVSTETGLLEQVLRIIRTERVFEKIMGIPPGSFCLFITGMEENENE